MCFEKKQAQPPTFLPSRLHVEWTLVTTTTYSNVLLLGSPLVMDTALVALEPHLRAPVHYWRPNKEELVPQPSDGTLVLLEVARLDMAQQVKLWRWLDRSENRARVVSTTGARLFSLVEAGRFLDNLYYRLNLVRIDLTADDGHRPRMSA